jgi:hypothetical protein
VIRVQVKGVQELVRALPASRIIKPPLRAYLAAAILKVEAETKPFVPRDTGYLARSLQSQVTDTEAKLSTNAPHALYVHGRMNETKSRSKPHWPPISAIAPWAQRHGVNPYVVARAISRRGTPLVPFMRLGLKQAQPYIRQVRSLARAIERKVAS